MNTKKHELNSYIQSRAIEINKKYPNLITIDQTERAYNKYKDNTLLKTEEGFKQIKNELDLLANSFISNYFKYKDYEKSYNPDKFVKEKPSYGARKLLDVLNIYKEFGETPKIIFDAGSGIGRNSIYFAQNGYDVVSVEMNEDFFKELTSNVKKEKIKNIKMVNKNVLEYLKTIDDDSLDAIFDSGMSSYLNDQDKCVFRTLALKKLKAGGFIYINHASEAEKYGRSIEYLRKMCIGFDSVIDWKTKDKITEDGTVLKINTGLYRKKSNSIPSGAIRYMVENYIYRLSHDKEKPFTRKKIKYIYEAYHLVFFTIIILLIITIFILIK